MNIAKCPFSGNICAHSKCFGMSWLNQIFDLIARHFAKQNVLAIPARSLIWMCRAGGRTSILQIIPPAPPAVETREGRRRAGEEPLGSRVREREITHTEVRRLHACKSVLGKFVFLRFKVITGVHCVARLSKNRPSKPVTPHKIIRYVAYNLTATDRIILFSKLVQFRVAHRVFLNPRAYLPSLCRGQSRYAPSRDPL